jgi:soluble lytic murein transglycosylase-like protein
VLPVGEGRHDIVPTAARTTRSGSAATKAACELDHGKTDCVLGPFCRQLAPMKLLISTCILLTALGATSARADRQQDPELGQALERAREAGACFEDKFDQQVWWAAMEPKLRTLLQDQQERQQILEHVHCEAKRLNLPPALVMAVIDVESKFDRWAVSSAGAVGLMQIMPFWPRKLGMSNAELVRIPQNIRMGCTILKFYLDREKGDYTKALARYNGSIGRRNYADLVLTRLANRWQYR